MVLLLVLPAALSSHQAVAVWTCCVLCRCMAQSAAHPDDAERLTKDVCAMGAISPNTTTSRLLQEIAMRWGNSLCAILLRTAPECRNVPQVDVGMVGAVGDCVGGPKLAVHPLLPAQQLLGLHSK